MADGLQAADPGMARQALGPLIDQRRVAPQMMRDAEQHALVVAVGQPAHEGGEARDGGQRAGRSTGVSASPGPPEPRPRAAKPASSRRLREWR